MSLLAHKKPTELSPYPLPFLHLSPERNPFPTPHKIYFLVFITCFILNHLLGCYPGVMGTSRAVPLLLIFIPPHIHSEHSTVFTYLNCPCRILRYTGRLSLHVHERQLSCLYRSTSYRLRLFLPFLLIFHLSVLATSFLCPIGLLCEYLELMLCDLHIEFRAMPDSPSLHS